MVTSQSPNMTDYEAERREFRLDVPEYFNFAADVIDKHAQNPDKEAMLWIGQHGEERHITFAHFSEASRRAANAFSTLGLGKGDPVLVMLPRIPEWWETILGLMRLGAIPIPCTTLLTPKDIQFRCEVAEARAFITDQEGAYKFDQVRGACPTVTQTILIAESSPDTAGRENWTEYHTITAEASPQFTGPKTRSDEPCLVYFTSGTVGYPKMVLHTHASYPIGHTITGKYWLDLHEDDLVWNLSETGAIFSVPGVRVRPCSYRMRVANSIPLKHWICSTSILLLHCVRHRLSTACWCSMSQ
jgi:acyl-coenzyme A synthetase/AMP-(fatty) acid ligase